MSKGICDKCKKDERVELVACQCHNGFVMVCEGCEKIAKQEGIIFIYDKAAAKLIPPLFHVARIEHLPTTLQGVINNLTKGLMLWGLPGVGKSYAMAAIMRLYIYKGGQVKRITYERLCLSLRATYKPDSKLTELDVISPLIKIDVLFIEDVGTTVSFGAAESDFSLRTFLFLLNERLEVCKPIFVTSNKSIEELERSFDGRVASRLLQACEVFHLTGPDKRRPDHKQKGS